MKLGQLQHDEDAMEEPNLTPLIDIVFILLIFFLVTTTFAKELGINVQRPEASSATSVADEVVRVAVGQRGEIAVDGQPTADYRLEAEVRDRIDERKRSVLLVADQNVDAKTLVDVMDACRKAGAEDVALAVEHP